MPMGRPGSSAVLRQIQTLFSAGSFSGLSDRQLLDRFLACRDAASESAFTVLVERHGPMVLSVCRRMLADPLDAEDAFQATFLVLVRKARSIQVDGSVGRWLFGVAARVAARARENGRRRRGRERSGLDRLESQTKEAATLFFERAELQSILAEEVGKLPAKFQAPVLLCDLEGQTHEAAARRLGWPVGTVKSRLWRARARLRWRLTRRGFAPEGFSIAVPFLPTALPVGLVETTTRAAQALIAGRPATVAVVAASVSTLTEGVLRSMFLTKIKLAAAALLVILTGSAALLGQATENKPSALATTLGGRAAPTGAPDSVANRNDELDVELLERAWVEAIPRRDASIISRIIADDFEGIDPVGNIFTKSTYLPDLAHGVFSDQPIELDEIKTRVFGDAAVATSRIKIAGYTTRGRMTNVYVKRQGRWQCVASHATGLVAAFPTKVGAARHQELLKTYLQQMGAKDHVAFALATSCTACHTANTDFGALEPSRALEVPKAPTSPVKPPLPCLVEKVLVQAGETVKKGQPLLGLLSTDLAAAKATYELAAVQWAQDKKTLESKVPLARANTLPQKELADAENAEAQSRLKFKLAKDKLLICGLSELQIAHIPQEDGKHRARMTQRCPADATIVEVDAKVGNYYDMNSTLLVIRPTAIAGPNAR
jgi:RNA polymerase sigma factor (sigma-70 family)